jgi:hypothetical protein
MCGNTVTKERCMLCTMPTSRSSESSPIFWHGGCVVDFPTTPINSCTSTSDLNAAFRVIVRKASKRAASQTLTSAFTLLYLPVSLPVLVLTGTLAVQVVAISNLKPWQPVQAQAIQAPSAPIRTFLPVFSCLYASIAFGSGSVTRGICPPLTSSTRRSVTSAPAKGQC